MHDYFCPSLQEPQSQSDTQHLQVERLKAQVHKMLQLKDAFESHQELLKDKDRQILRFKHQNESLAQIKKEHADLIKITQKLKHQLERTRAQKQASIDQLQSSTQSQLAQLNASLSQQIYKAKGEVQMSKVTISRLQSMLTSLKQNIKHKEKEALIAIEVQKSRTISLEDSNERLSKELEELHLKEDQLRSQLELKQEIVLDLNQTVESLKSELQRISDKDKEKEHTMACLKERCTQLQLVAYQERACMGVEVERGNTKLKQYERKLQEYKLKTEQLDSQLKVQIQDNQRLKDRLNRTTLQVKQLQIHLQNQKETVSYQQQMVGRLKREVEVRERRIGEMERCWGLQKRMKREVGMVKEDAGMIKEAQLRRMQQLLSEIQHKHCKKL